jgi:DNA-binding HxlR family transcriptional regulator
MRASMLREGTTGRKALELFSRKWVILTLYALFSGTHRLGELRRVIEGVSEKMLIQTLRELEAAGLVERTVHHVLPPHVDYALTPLGESLRAPITGMCEWGAAHMADVERARSRGTSEAKVRSGT